MVETGERLICASTALVDGGGAVRFSVLHSGEEVPAFIVRYRSNVHAYINRCAHRGINLDWDPGRFFDYAGRYLICAVHGAVYEPATGTCVGGPCNKGLVKLAVIEKNNAVYLASSDATRTRRDGKQQ
jgi:nitrite reductase/ring-hydroxylating ferredoxin subunit